MITSPANAKVKRLVLLRDKSRARNKEGVFIAEGIKMFAQAPLKKLREVYVSETFWQQALKEKDGESLLAEAGKKLRLCMEREILVEQVTEEVFKKVSDTQTPQGILFVMEQFSYSFEKLLQEALRRSGKGGKPPLFLLLEDVQDPGNLGTMLRTGEGAGIDGLVMSRGTADIYNPKTIRSTMGSLYRVPFLYADELCQAIGMLKQSHIPVYAAHLKGERYFDEISYKGGCAFLVGNEGKGLREETAGLADQYLKIPMEGELESLNAAVAAALLLYQARRGI